MTRGAERQRGSASQTLVPLFDIRLRDSDVEAVTETLRSGWLTMGPKTSDLEQAFAAHIGVRHAVATSSCTTALHLAYLAAGVGRGDEVIVPAMTFVASAAAVRYCGATPVLADIHGVHDLSLDPDSVARRISKRTKAVCLVHYAGYGGDVDALLDLCERHGLALIEDAAHAPSAAGVGGGPKLGGYGLAGCFSFFSNKVLSCGEGGMVVTDDERVAALARSLRSHAMTSGTWDRHRGHATSYDVVATGFNYRIDEPRAALLLSRLGGLEEDIASRRRLVHRYREMLGDAAGVRLPYRAEEVDRSSCYVMPVTVDPGIDRERLRAFMLEERGIQTSVLYPAVHEFTAYAGSNDSLPRSELVARTELTLPLYPHLTEEDQDRVVDALRDGIVGQSGVAGAAKPS